MRCGRPRPKPQLDVCIDGGVEPLRRDNGVGHLIVVVPQPLVLVERIGLVLQVKQALAFQLAMPGVIVVVDPDDQVQIILVILCRASAWSRTVG